MKVLIPSKIFLYSLFLILPSYLIGIALTELLTTLLIIAFFFSNRDLIYFKNFKSIFLIIFSLLVTLSGIINLDSKDLKIASLVYIRFAIFSIAIFYFLEKFFDKENVINKNFLKFFFLIILFIISDSLIQFFFGTNLFGQQIQQSRVSGIFGRELILGSFLLQLLPLTFLLLLFSKMDISKKQVYLIIYFSLYFIIIYISGNRSPFFLTILFAVTMVLFEKNFRKIILKCLSILIIFIICEAYFDFGKTKVFAKVFVMTFAQFTDSYYQPQHNKNTSRKRKTYNKDITDELSLKNKAREFFDSLVVFSDDHHNHYILALKLFKEKPILGNGPKGFRQYCRRVNYDPPTGICSTHPHNYFFQVLSELGLLGILFYLFGLSFIIIKSISLKYQRSKNLIISSFQIISIGLLVLLFPLVPSGNFFNNWLSIINYYYIGIYIYFYNQIFLKN